MAHDTDTRTAVGSDRPVTELTDTPVYTRDGYRLGRVAGVTVNIDAGCASGLLVGGVDERRFPDLPTGPRGVRVPYDRIEGVGDVVVVDVPGAFFGAEAGGGTDSVELSEALADGSRGGRRNAANGR